MKKIFIGMLLVFLDFNLTLGSSNIGLIPDFLGYIIMLNGLNELVEKSESFAKAKSVSMVMVIYSAILYAMDLLGISITMSMYILLPLGLISTIISLYVSYNIVMGVKDMETAECRDLNVVPLYSVWKLLAIFFIGTFVMLFIPILSMIGLIGGFIVAICFLVSFSKSKNLYYTTQVQGYNI